MSAPIDWDEDMPGEEPARKPWAEALGLSTSAKLRQVERELAEAYADRDDLLRRRIIETARPKTHLEAVKAELDKALRERDAARAQLDRAREQSLQLGKDLASVIVAKVVIDLENRRLRAEVERLTALLDRMPGYHLTDKGRAATDPTHPEEQP